MKTTNKEIRYVNYGLANSYSNRIEMHKDLLLPKYSKLHGRLLAHELAHSDKAISWEDIIMDMRIDPQAFSFMVTRPETWCDFSPVWIRGGNWTMDWNLIIFYGFTAILAGLFTIFTRRYI